MIYFYMIIYKLCFILEKEIELVLSQTEPFSLARRRWVLSQFADRRMRKVAYVVATVFLFILFMQV